MGKTDTAKSILEEGFPDKTIKGIVEAAAPDNVVAKGLNLAGNLGDNVLEAPVGWLSTQLNKVGNWMRSRTRESL